MLLARAEALVAWGNEPYSANTPSKDVVKMCFSSSTAWIMSEHLHVKPGMENVRLKSQNT